MAIDGEMNSNITIIDTIARHRVVAGGAIAFSRLSTPNLTRDLAEMNLKNLSLKLQNEFPVTVG